MTTHEESDKNFGHSEPQENCPLCMKKIGADAPTKGPMDGCERCPTCHLVPAVKPEERSGAIFAIVLACEQHGHEAQGETLEKAVANWNHYVKFIRQEGR